MQSTLLGYQLIARDFAASIARAEAEPTTKRETAYYEANIGKVKSLDDFLDNYRLYSYAMKAYGLEDQINSKAFMRKVLESDLSKADSFANKLTDGRYRSFAAAFSFKAADASTFKAVTTAQLGDIVEAYSDADVRRSTAAAQKAAGFTARIGAIADVDAFMGDAAVYEVAMRSVGLDPALADRAAVRDVLTGATTAPTTALQALADTFRFDSLGAPATGGILNGKEPSAVVRSYYVQQGLAATPVAAAHETAYFKAKIGGIGSAAALVADPRLLAYVVTSVGLDPTYETAAYIESVLKDDPSNPSGVIASISGSDGRKAAMTRLNAVFDFPSPGGTMPPGTPPTDAAGIDATVSGYFDSYDDAAAKKDATQTKLFKAALSSPTRADALIRSETVFNYLMTAFELDPSTESRTKILRVLKSDPSDPKSYVNSLKDERYQRLAAAFNFDEKGKVAAERLVQSQTKQTATVTLYTKTLGESPTQIAKDVAKKATAAYAEALTAVVDIDDFVNDGTITDFALKAYGLDGEKLKPADLKALLKSDLTNPESVARKKGDQRFIDFVAAFNFAPDGSIERQAGTVQSAADRLAVRQAYVRQVMEEKAGETDGEGVRLALYVQRKADKIATPYQLLADKAMVEFTRTLLGLPAQFSQLDLEKQASILKDKVDFKAFKDPKAVDRMIAKFAGLYDIANSAGGGAAQSGALSILSGGGGSNLLGYL